MKFANWISPRTLNNVKYIVRFNLYLFLYELIQNNEYPIVSVMKVVSFKNANQ